MCILEFLKNNRNIFVFALHCGGAGKKNVEVQEEIVPMLSHARVVILGVRGCVRDPTLTRDENILLYISGCKPQSYESILWGLS